MRLLLALLLLLACQEQQLDTNTASDRDWCEEAGARDPGTCFAVTACGLQDAEECLEPDPIEGCEREYERGYQAGAWSVDC